MINVEVLTTEGKYNQQKNKLMDSGANRGLTRYANLLHKYRRIKRIPVTGIGENGAACYIVGVGYMNIETTDGKYIECKMYHAPDCSSTVISPNSIVRGSQGLYTSWTQTSHVVKGMATITFFNQNDRNISDQISMTLSNDLWYTQQNYKRLLRHANPTELFTATCDDDTDQLQQSVFAGKLNAATLY